MPHPQVIIIGSGFSGLAAASCLAQAGFRVTLLEKNQTPGGRAREFRQQGYTFDMGPSWYWMPEVFESFFQNFNSSVADHYQLRRLDPSYQVIFNSNEKIVIPAAFEEIQKVFDEIEPGSGIQLCKFLHQAGIKYRAGMHDLVYQPGNNLWEFVNLKTLKGLFTLDIFQSFDKHVKKYFNSSRIQQMLSFPILFLGASARETPALYSLMNYADLKLGTWYPQGGMFKIVEAMVALAESLGVQFEYGQQAKEIVIKENRACEVVTGDNRWGADIVLAAADYQHVESQLLAPRYRSYSPQYWDRRTLAPSSLIYYLGVNRSIPGLLHHNLFFDEDLDQHTREIYDNPQWPSKPLFYVAATSKTDPSVCPPGHENLFVLIPVAPGLADSPEVREKYYQLVMQRMEQHLETDVRSAVVFKQSYAHRDFISDYNAFKGNAYGLANTLKQTAFLKPKIRSKKVNNLFFAGQLTVPGPGVPPSLISGQVVAQEIIKSFKI